MRSEEWARIRLGNVCSKIGSGATPRGGSEVYLDHGPYALIRSQNIYNDGFHQDGLAFIGERHAAELANVEVQDNDVLLNITGDSVARVCQVDLRVLPARVNQHVAIVRPDPTKLDPKFLRYYLASPRMQAQLLSWAGSGGTRNALTKAMIESLHVLAPSDVAEQRAIAGILGALDDKIELNRRTNETLEGIARAIFKSWFVDFDPVRRNAEGGRPRDELDALFPDGFEDSALGPIPRGWRAATISNVASISKIAVKPWENSMKVWEHYSIPAYDAGGVAVGDVGESIRSGKFRVPSTCVLVSKLNPQFPRVWLPDVQDEASAICSTEFIPFVPRYPEWRSYLYELMRSDPVQQGIGERVTGSTGSRQRAHPIDIALIPVVEPSQETLRAFNRIEHSIHARIRTSIRQSQSLTVLRDTLLPKLISGELRGPDAERIMEARI